MDDDGLLTSPQVCELTGASYRQLDYWARASIVAPARVAISRRDRVSPLSDEDVERRAQIIAGLEASTPGSGRYRLWDPADIPFITMLARLVRVGVKPQTAHRALIDGGWIGDGFRIVYDITTPLTEDTRK